MQSRAPVVEMNILLLGTDHLFNGAYSLLNALYYYLRPGNSHVKPTQLTRSKSCALIPVWQTVVCMCNISIGQIVEIHPELLIPLELFYPIIFIDLDLDSMLELWIGNKA